MSFSWECLESRKMAVFDIFIILSWNFTYNSLIIFLNLFIVGHALMENVTAQTEAKVSSCTFTGYQAICHPIVDGIQTLTLIKVNHCHKPIDVTLRVESKQRPINWEYTYVTSNTEESPEIPGFSKKVYLHVKLLNNVEDAISIEADFHVGNEKDPLFIKDTVPITTIDDCLQDPSQNSSIALAIILTILVLSLIAGALVWHFRRRRIGIERMLLVEDTDGVGVPGSRPYQEGQSSNDSKYRVEYRAGTVIHNSHIDSSKQNEFEAPSVKSQIDYSRIPLDGVIRNSV